MILVMSYLRSVACIMAECMTRSVLFPGTETFFQIGAIASRIGYLDADFESKVSPDMQAWILQFAHEIGQPIAELVPGVSYEFNEVLKAILKYDPVVRISAADLLDMPFFLGYHDPANEHVATHRFPLGDEGVRTVADWKSKTYQELIDYAATH